MTHDKARFGHPVKGMSEKGMHITLQVIPKHGEDIYALAEDTDARFPEDEIEFGEQLEEAIRRIVHDVLGAALNRYRLGTMQSRIAPEGHWRLTLVAIAQTTEPRAQQGKELVKFTESTIPSGLIGWTGKELQELLDA